MFSSPKFEEIVNRHKKGILPHAYIFNTNNIEELKKDLNLLIKNILCNSEFSLDCKKDCNICRLFDNLSLPNYIEVYPDGMQIKKEQVDFIKDKFNKKPVYGEYNIYVINNCDFLNDKSSNILLKFLEEPEDKILGFFVTDNVERVLPTIKSRCEIVNVYYDITEEIENEYLDNVINLINYVKSDSNIYLVYDIVFGTVSYNRKDFFNLLTLLINQFDKNIKEGNIIYLEGFDIKKSIKSMDLIKNTLSKIESNVNIEVAIILFAEELRNIYE